MSSDITRAIMLTTPNGGRSRSSCARPKAFLRSMCMPRRATLPPAAKFSRPGIFFLPAALAVAASLCGILPAAAQVPVSAPPPRPPGTQPPAPQRPGKGEIKVVVDLAVPHTTALDDPGRLHHG